MRRRSLRGRDVTMIGCGDVSLAIAAARGVDSREVERALHEALSLGITLVDVHDEQDAERLAGEALRVLRLRDAVTLATRVPLRMPRPGFPAGQALTDRLPIAYLQEQIEATLRATHLDALPLAQLPVSSAWLTSSAWPELAGTCARLSREGKVVAWGARLDTVDEAALGVAAEPWLASVQATFNLCDRGAEPLLAAATAHELLFLARRPLAGGGLAGTLGPGVRLTPRDDRNELDAAALERFAVLAARLAPLVRTEPPAARSCEAARAVLDRGRRPEHLECVTLAELALRFVLDRGAIALPRLHRHAHLPDTLAALVSAPLSPALVARALDEKPAAPR